MEKCTCTCKNCDCKVIDLELVKKTLEAKPDEQEFSRLSLLFKIMGDKTRLKLIWTLERGEMCVSDITNVIDMTKSSVSHQLAVLREAGIVAFRRVGKEIYYRLDDEHIEELYAIGLNHIEHKMKGEEK